MPGRFSQVEVTPDDEGLLRCIRRQGPPERVHFVELFLDREIQDAVCERYGLLDGLNPADEFRGLERHVRVQRFLGYDYVRCGLDGFVMPLKRTSTQDTAALPHPGGRNYMELHRGPITNWDEFHAYPWPELDALTTRSLEWYSENLPEGMCIIGSGGFGHFAEYLSWLMGYETLCFALFDHRELVRAISDRLFGLYEKILPRILEFERVKIVWGSDDMGFRTGTLISPDDLREFVLPGHRLMAKIAHCAGRPYMLHSCGKLTEIMEDLIEDVRIDARHSFEDVIEPVTEAYEQYHNRIAIVGGIDVDFLCRASPEQVRRRVRRTLDRCMPEGGYCLGTGNSVTNYIPLENYLAMLDEGRKYLR